MSATDIIGVLAAAMQFSGYVWKIVKYIDQSRKADKAYHESLVELQSKLTLFRTTLDSLQRAAETIKSSKNRTKMELIAYGPMKTEIEEAERTLKRLFTCQGQYQKPKDYSTLKLVVSYWVFDHKGKAIVKSGISEIADRVDAIKQIVNEILTHVATDTRDVVHEIQNSVHEQKTGDHPPYSRTLSNDSTASTASSASNTSADSRGSAASDSTDITTYSDVETETPLKYSVSQWDIDLPLYEEVVAESSGLSAAIISAIEEKNYKTVAGLLKSGVSPLAKDDSGWCVFHYAVRAGSKTVMRELLASKKVIESKGFDIKDNNGDTALHFASLLGMKAMAKELIKAGCNRDALNNGGHSPLSIAVNKKQVGMVEILLEYKAECIPPSPDKLRKIRNEINYLKSKAA